MKLTMQSGFNTKLSGRDIFRTLARAHFSQNETGCRSQLKLTELGRSLGLDFETIQRERSAADYFACAQRRVECAPEGKMLRGGGRPQRWVIEGKIVVK